MEINIIPVISSSILSKVHKVKSVYSSSFPVRGIALLFFNIEFTDLNYPPRHGVEHDLDNLSRLFHKLNYNVTVIKNAPRDDVRRELEFQSRNVMHRNFSSLVLGFSTHWAGTNRAVACADGKSMYLHDIYRHFDNKNCPFLAGKPKFLFFDASFGCAKDRAVRIDRALNPPKVFEPVKKKTSDITFSLSNIRINSGRRVEASPNDMIPVLYSSPDVSQPSYIIAEKSDFIIACSTFEGYVSWRRNSHGCWFSRVMAEVFQKHACDCNVVELLKRVRRKLSCIETNTGCKQVNMTIDTTLKEFYFFPGV